MIHQEELPMVELASMNDTHLEDIILINRISNAIENENKKEVSELLNELILHTVDHFSGEELMMMEKKFPPYFVHKSEHDRALNELRENAKIWDTNNDFQQIQYYIDFTLKNWIINHIQTMDTVTAKFLVHGISPCSSGAC